MKSLFFLLVLLFLCFSCNDDDDFRPIADADIVGEWQLIEVLADPGDGSGTFEPVNSDRVINFTNDGRFTATGDLCQFNITIDNASAGSYDVSANTIAPDDCVTIGGTPIRFNINSAEMIITYLCIEGCQHKYRKR